jgi:acyl-CoA reductase-like NAD-dependent aldehyde dehydrogenase
MKMLLAGEWVARDETIEVCDPFDGSVIDSVPSATADDVETALVTAAAATATARKLATHERARILLEVAAIVNENFEEFARTIAREGSKTIREARKETSRCVNTLTISAEEAKRLQGETIPFDSFPGGEQRRGHFERVPVGVVLAITPFNDPLNLVAHKLGPAIAGGNAVVGDQAHRSIRRGRIAGRRAADDHRSRRGARRDPGIRPQGAPGFLYRRRRGGTTDHEQGRAQEGRHGARLQLAGHRVA